MKRKEPPGKRTLLHHVLALGFGALSLLYLVNPTAGIIEMIPDNIPVVGNLDEAGATLLLINVLAFYGIDLNRFGGGRRKLDE